MKMLMAAYQEQLKAIGFAGLGLRPVPHPLAETNGRFIGSKKCAESCHEISYDIWKKTLHAQAYDTLAKLDPPRNFDPECVSCHVTGWNPQKFFPYESGYQSQKKTPHLINTGCEDCHGPGEKHAAAELAGSEALQEKATARRWSSPRPSRRSSSATRATISTTAPTSTSTSTGRSSSTTRRRSETGQDVRRELDHISHHRVPPLASSGTQR